MKFRKALGGIHRLGDKLCLRREILVSTLQLMLLIRKN
jgi:hypothetical protein